MRSTENFFDQTFPREIYQQMLAAAEDQNLVQTLTDMQMVRGVGADEARQTARLCVAAVASCEGIREAAYENSEALLDQLLESADLKTVESRALLLHKLYFGLTAHGDPAVVEALAQGVSAEALFWRYYTAQPQQTAASLTALEAEIRRTLHSYDLSPQVVRALVKRMDMTGDYFATFAALGEGGSQYKCIVAMELYLRSGGMTMHEAANLACTGVETQAVADAVAKGFLTRDRAKKILVAVAIAAVVIGVGIMLYQAGAALMAAKTAAAMAEVVNAHTVAELPAVFAQFATTTTASGAPAIQLAAMSAEAVSNLAASMEQAAVARQAIGFVTALLGVGLARFSERAADAIGKFAAVLQKDPASIRAGVEALADEPVRNPAGQEQEEDMENPAVIPAPVIL